MSGSRYRLIWRRFMDSEVKAYIEILDYMRDEIKKAIQGMTAEELNWMPLPKDTNSAAVLITHLAGAESFRIHQVVGGTDIGRNRDAEFAAKARNVAQLEALLDRTGAKSTEVLRNVSARDLDRVVTARAGEAPASMRWNILYNIQHYGQHLAAISLTRQLYAARKG
ncbi:MAG: DUF664 domain-containing protein [Dehalococcoidia bacterium]|nr:DUF664 domain-containing protein [Dehalococcoidia bacterium]